MKVSVAIITYNHEAFIAQALDSILGQQTEFEFEIVVVEDCSSDATANIVRQYQKRFPSIIRAFFHATNQGPRNTMEQALLACTGQYIALLDGDDYWTSPKKLQKQVELMDSHPEMTMCFHPTTYVFDDGEQRISHPETRLPEFTLENLIGYNPVHSQSIMFRKSIFSGYPSWMHEHLKFPGDYYLVINAALKGSIGFIDEPMSVYRVHDQGVWGNLDYCERLSVEMKINRLLRKWLGRKYAYRLLLAWLSLTKEKMRCHARMLLRPILRMGQNR